MTPEYDRLIVHKFDPLTPAPGGIDTCIRGILRYAGNAGRIAVVGVDGSNGLAPNRTLGVWETHSLGGAEFFFLPVAKLDPGNQVRRVPHAVVVARGLMRFRRQITPPRVVQTHRADLGWLVTRLWRRAAHTYFIHTQESGLLGGNSDSFWRRAAPVHRGIERSVVRRARAVRVFNPTYAEVVRRWSPVVRFSPTWWDPALVLPHRGSQSGRAVLWVGRLEQPKNPLLAIDALADLLRRDPGAAWHLTLVGTGNLSAAVANRVAALGLEQRVTLAGRLPPAGVMSAMATSDYFLMTSVVGYEGYPRVLVEALASGLPAVVTVGSDTGGLVTAGTGLCAKEEPTELAAALMQATRLDGAVARESVNALSAPTVIQALYAE